MTMDDLPFQMNHFELCLRESLKHHTVNLCVFSPPNIIFFVVPFKTSKIIKNSFIFVSKVPPHQHIYTRYSLPTW
jgi:hypothetical protein